MFFTYINNNNSADNANLRCGKTYSARVVQGFCHIIYKLCESVIKFNNLTAVLCENAVALFYNMLLSHIYKWRVAVSRICFMVFLHYLH